MAGEVTHQFPASAAKSLVEGYCQDFVSLAASLAQTLEQVSMRNLPIDPLRDSLVRTERGMRQLADAIGELLNRGTFSATPKAPEPAPAAVAPAAPVAAPAPAATAPPPGPYAPLRPGPAAAPAAPPPPPAKPRPARTPAAAAEPARFARQAPPPEPDNPLRGSTQTMPLLSVFQFLCRMRKSGTLHVHIAEEHITFEFVSGAIEFTSSDRCPPDERIGDILLRKHPALRGRIEPVLERLGRVSVRKLGGVLVQEGLVSNGQVVEALEEQVQVRFHRAITTPRANYEFEEGERVPGDGRIRIRPFELVYASKQRPK